MPGSASIVQTEKKQDHKAARLEMELLFAEPTKLIGDGCHARRCLADPGDLPKGGDVMRLKSRFHRVVQMTRVWSCEAFRVRLEWDVPPQLRFEEARFSNLGGQ